MSNAIAIQRFQLAALSSTLEAHGFDLQTVDIDLHRGVVVIQIHRFDGRWWWLHADARGTVLESWQRTVTLGRHPSSKPGVPLSPQINDTFLGRSRCEGFRSGLRTLASRLADNPAPGRPVLTTASARLAMRAIASQLHLNEHKAETD